jgi:hypothetical protein
MTPRYRTAIAAYVAAGRHLSEDRDGAKTVKQMARDIGTDPNTVRRWLRRDHRQLWMEYWPTINELWEPARVGKHIAQTDPELMAALDNSLEKLIAGASC